MDTTAVDPDLDRTVRLDLRRERRRNGTPQPSSRGRSELDNSSDQNTSTADFAARGAATDEAIAILTELWTADDPEFSGRFHRFAGLRFSPKPVQRPLPPIWIGGSSRAAMHRAGAVGNGWHLFRKPDSGLRAAIGTVSDAAAAAGRDAVSFVVSVRCDLEILDGNQAPTAETTADYNSALGERFRLRGTPGQIIDTIGVLREAGVDHLVLAVNSSDPHRTSETLRRFAADITPRFD